MLVAPGHRRRLRPALRVSAAVALALACLALPGCSRRAEQPAARSTAQPAAAQPAAAQPAAAARPAALLPALEDVNVVLIVIDTVGAEHLGCYGRPLPTSPNLDRLASEGVRFERAYTTAPWTQPAVASLLTSLTPSDHGVRRVLDSLPPERQTLAELLRERGFRTAGVVSHLVLKAEYGYGQGFDSYDESAVGDHRAVTGHKTTAAAVAALDTLAASRFFLFVHYFDPHWHYNHHRAFDFTADYGGRLLPGTEIGRLRAMAKQLTPEDVEYLRRLHGEELAYTDYCIFKLVDRLRELGVADNTLLVVTADHGEEFMRHGWIGHTATLYEELIRVPLIVHFPRALAPRVVGRPVSTLDVLPTLLGLSRRPAAAPPWQGASLAGLLAGDEAAYPPERPQFAEVSYVSPAGYPSGDDGPKNYFKTALVTDRWKVIHDLEAQRWSLFDLRADPEELRDLAGSRRRELADLQAQLGAWEAPRVATWDLGRAPAPAVDAENMRRLRSLGYVH
jgi:arylsulfatase A-like enzyme